MTNKAVKKPVKKPTLVTLSDAHREWLQKESENTGEPMTGIIRRAIQEQINKGK